METAAWFVNGMSSQGRLPAALSRVHPVTRTPLTATASITAILLALALWLPLVTLAKATSFITLTVFALINLSLWRIKRRDPQPVGIRTYASWVPIVGFVISAGFVLFQIANLLRS